jgi:diacylglycerol kinase (ATP)
LHPFYFSHSSALVRSGFVLPERETAVLRARFLIIHNPNAGPMARHLYRATLSRLTRRGANVEIVETASHGEGMKAAAEAALSGRFDAVVAAGGDGTVHDAAEGLVGHSIPLGILPLGTGNVFARELKLPTSPDMIARTLLFGDVRTVPVGQANGRPFLFVVGVGFDAEAVRLFESEGNRTLGRAGYIPVLRALLSHQDQPLRVRTRREEAKAQWVVVTRIKRYAGGLILVPQADVHQPSLYVVRFVGSGPLNRLRQLSALALGLLRYDPAVHLEPADWVRIEGNRTVPVQIDGEVLGELPLEISFHPKHLRLVSIPGVASIFTS